jgi:Uma2 family endonuclease
MTYEPPASGPRQDSVLEAALEAFLVAEDAGLLGGVSVAWWDVLPEDFCRDHELDRGEPIKRQSGSPGHQTAMRRLANAIEQAARSAVREGLHDCVAVNHDVDVRLWDVPGATVRRPDVLAHRCLEVGDTTLWAHSVLLVVEIVSPSSEADDTGRDNRRTGFESKMTQYALAGIEHYWIVRLRPDDSAIAGIERWRLEPDYRGAYAKVAVWTNGVTDEAISTELPFPIQATWADLEF